VSQQDYQDDELDSKPSFEEALEELKSDNDSLPSPALVLGLSGLNDEQMAELRPVWKSLAANYRRILMQMLVDSSEASFELDFQPIGWDNLNAEQPEVRQSAIEVLWEDDSPRLMRELLRIAQQDMSNKVRAEAVKGLGRFVLLGEMESIPEKDAKSLQDFLLALSRDSREDLDLRRFAVESLGHCTSKATMEAIKTAYSSEEPLFRQSAIVAMGRSYDERWEENILKELKSDDDDMRREAVRAAGELQIAEAVPAIIRFINEVEDEREVAIWSLGEIGGKEAMRVLENLLEAAEEEDDEDLIELIDEAMSNASLADGNFMMLDISEDDFDDFDEN
jgi:HEAT repeat protein